MRIGGLFRASDAQPSESEIRAARVDFARGFSAWTEIEETDLVRRPPNYLVHVETDTVLTLHRGVVFQRDSASLVADRVPLWFFVEQDTGEVVFLETAGSTTWSEIYERQCRREAARG